MAISEPGGRAVLRVAVSSGKVEHDHPAPTSAAPNWELRLEGKDSVLVFYSLDGVFPSSAQLDSLVTRLTREVHVD